MEARRADQDRRIGLLGGAILVGISFCLSLLIGRLAYINTSMAPKLTALAVSQHIGRMPLPARRGCILDSAGRIVAGTRQRPSVYADPGMVEDVVETARLLGPMLGMHAGEVEEKLRDGEGTRFCWLRRSIDPVDAESVTALKLGGIGLMQEDERSYPMGALMGPVVGFVGIDGVGLEGLEKHYDEHLRGADGQRVAVYGGGEKRRPIWWRSGLSKSPVDGGHIVLTLDSVIQEIAEECIARAVAEFRAEAGVVVVMTPTNGELLAVAQYPDFDPNRFGDASPAARRNRAICDAVEPGSTFKPYVACAALRERVIGPNEQVDCGNGQRYFGGRLMHDTSPQERLDFVGIIAKSSNIGMGILGERLGNAAIHDVVTTFGFGRATGVGFPGEADGMVQPLAKWTSYSTTSVPIGQEIAVTPLQLATAMSAIVNGGTLLKPRLVRTLLAADGEVLESFDEPEVVARVLPEDIARYMTRDVLVRVVLEGGGKAAALADWQVCGKTGTAEVPYKDRRGYEPNAYIGSFIGAAPAEDPQIVALVMVYRPSVRLGYYGRQVAAPAAGEIMGRTLAYLQTPASPTATGPGTLAGRSSRHVEIE